MSDQVSFHLTLRLSSLPTMYGTGITSCKSSSDKLAFAKAPDASRSSIMGASQQPPSTPTSARAGDPSASAAFASPLHIPEGGMHPQALIFLGMCGGPEL